MADSSVTVDNGTLPDYQVKALNASGEAIQQITSAGLALRMDEGVTYTYIGEALPGTLVASAGWRIKRLTNATNTIEWAGGDSEADKVWNDRASLIYS